jgi:hypothetical protein
MELMAQKLVGVEAVLQETAVAVLGQVEMGQMVKSN